MTCGSCVAAITNALEATDGVSEVAVSLVTNQGSVKYSPSVVPVEEILERIEDCGFDAALVSNDPPQRKSRAEEVKIKVYGMTCSSCSNTVENTLREVEGVKSAVVALSLEEATVNYDPAVVGVRALIERIEDCGFDAMLSKSLNNASQIAALSRVKEIQAYRSDLIRCLAFSIPVFVLSMLVPHVLPFLAFLKFRVLPGLYFDDILNCALTIPVQFGVGARFYSAAWKAIKHKAPTMDVLVCLSTSCAFFYSCVAVVASLIAGYDKRPSTLWDTSTMLVTFVMMGKYLENKAKGQTSVALSRLISLVPSTATIYESPEVAYAAAVTGKKTEDTSSLGEKTISTDLLQVNDIAIIRPGEKIPADGIVLSGSSYVSEALITGESFPITKNEGDFVIGGSVNGPGRIDIRISKVGEDTKLSHIVRLVRDAQTSRAPIQRFADYLATYFVPTVILLGLATFTLWMVVAHVTQNPPKVFKEEVAGGSFFICLRLCISVIVVACPCALGLATPTAVMVGTGVGAEHGILIKGGAILETANGIDTVLFDKTGTLTLGKMVVNEYSNYYSASHPTFTEKDWWRLIALIESSSEHPVAHSVIEKAQEVLGDSSFGNLAEGFKVFVGMGVQGSATLAGGRSYDVIVGNMALFKEKGIEVPSGEMTHITASDKTIVAFAIDGEYAGWISMSDAAKPDARAAVEALKRLGMRVGMVTGDNLNSARRIGKIVAIEDDMIWAGVTPEGKIDLIRNLQDNTIQPKRSIVAMVGDGINDSPALAASSLGIALSGSTDVAMEAADIVLLKEQDELLDVAAALHLSRKSFYRIKINLVWALIYNVVMIPFAMGCFIPFGIMLDPMIAGAAMALSSVSVVVSSLFLQRWQPPKWMTREYLDDESSTLYSTSEPIAARNALSRPSIDSTSGTQGLRDVFHKVTSWWGSSPKSQPTNEYHQLQTYE
ncbi:copper-transporting ATPase [Trichomonascus vanleenenianus]|uniref:Cu(2+)-transporting P-type ATPase CCC2 n=1 Tax=Trichomonascus vanleenenianus TaxID=2268995 RepID=UPI003ECB1957